jgi:Protein of unknown function (DUF3800)
MLIYLDESGNLGGFGSNTSEQNPYFVLAALIVEDDLPIKRCIKEIRRKKIKKRYKRTSELKFSESDDNIKRRVLECIGRTNSDIGYALLRKASVTQRYRSSHYGTVDRLSCIYNDICKRLVYKIITDSGASGPVDVIIDKSLYGIQRAYFDSYLADRTGLVVPASVGEVRVSHVDSRRCPSIQAADFIAGAISRKYRENDELYYKMIQHKISVRLDI